MSNKKSEIEKLQSEVERLKKELKKKKKYGLVWEEKPEEVFEMCKERLPVLKEVKKKEIITNKNGQANLLIEGDNYHALSVLNYTHSRKIDFIYIDPPYNTGNNTWKYNNKYVDEEDPYKHSKWISFIEKRLKLAKNLLTEKGIICVTIDNYEIHNIRHLMEETFPHKEIIVTVIEHNFRGRAKNNFALTHEYALWAVNKGEDLITKKEEVSDDIRRNLRRTGQGSKREESPTLFYGIEVNKETLEIISATDPIPENVSLPKSKKIGTVYIYPIDRKGVERRWYYAARTMLDEAKKGNVYAKTIRGEIEIHYWKPGKPKKRKSVWTGPKYDGSTYGSELLTEIIGENDFPYPKSLYAVYESIKAGTDKKDAIILDFFAGSGTTGHAVLEINKKDGGNRKFILCTNNENRICEEITYPRIKNVIKGYKYKGKDKILLLEQKLNFSLLKKADKLISETENFEQENQESNEYEKFIKSVEDNKYRVYGVKIVKGFRDGLGGNLKYFKTDFVDYDEPTDKNKIKLTKQATEMLCVKEGTFDLIRGGKDYKIFKNSNHYTGIIWDQNSIQSFKKTIKDIKGKFSIYVFSLGDETFDEEFKDVKQKVKLSPIPEAILRVYRRIFR